MNAKPNSLGETIRDQKLKQSRMLPAVIHAFGASLK
jgi:hypothetical protein